jgi:hypothetical protein
MHFQTTGKAKVKTVRCCVLFDPADGNIHHVHRVVTMEGALDTSEKQMATRTLQLAKDKGLDTNRLQLLHVDPAALATRGRYKVDLKTRSIVKH